MKATSICTDGRHQGVVIITASELNAKDNRHVVLKRQWQAEGEAVSHALRVIEEQKEFILTSWWSKARVGEIDINKSPLVMAAKGE